MKFRFASVITVCSQNIKGCGGGSFGLKKTLRAQQPKKNRKQVVAKRIKGAGSGR